MITPLRRILSWIVLLPLPVIVAKAEADASASSAPPAAAQEKTIPLFRDIFEIDLPMTERPGEVRFSFQPHFRDLINKTYLRTPLELRWGVTDRFELNSYIDTYFTHGLRQGGSGYGINDLHFGAKYAWLEWLKPTWDASVGFNTSIPVSRPPPDLTDGHNHFTPYIVFGRKLDALPGLSEILNFGVDLVSTSSTPGGFGKNEPHSSSLSLRPGFLYDRGAWHYTLEIDGTTTRLIGNGNHDFLTIRPGIVWDLPKVLVFNARGRWLAGFSLTFVFGPDGNTISTGGRFRGEVNLMHWFQSRESSGNQLPASAPGH
jgi:hypothetical protein